MQQQFKPFTDIIIPRRGISKQRYRVCPYRGHQHQPCRAMHPKTNEINKGLLESTGIAVKIVTKKRIVGLRNHLMDHSTITAKHLHSYQDHSSLIRKTQAGTILKVDMQW